MKAMAVEGLPFWSHKGLEPLLLQMRAQMVSRDKAAEETQRGYSEAAEAAKEAKKAERLAQSEAQKRAAEDTRLAAAARAERQARADPTRSAPKYTWRNILVRASV